MDTQRVNDIIKIAIDIDLKYSYLSNINYP